MPAIDLAAALAVVRGAPANQISALAQTDLQAAAEADKAAKRKAELAAKVEAAIPARTEQIVADYLAVEQAAIRQAATDLARRQVELEMGLTDVRSLAMSGGWPTRIVPRILDAARAKMAGSMPLPWQRAAGAASAYRSAMLAQAAAPKAPDTSVEDRIEHRKVQIAEQNQARIAARKRAAGIGR